MTRRTLFTAIAAFLGAIFASQTPKPCRLRRRTEIKIVPGTFRINGKLIDGPVQAWIYHE